jgi:holo-[acyl-carrier protein] synthase
LGVDVVAVERFAAALRRTPPLAARLFAEAERVTASGHPRSAASLAARFAVKEAVAKALGVPAGMEWHDCSVVSETSGRPVLVVSGTVAAAAGIREWRISLSHDAGIAAAIVVGLG